MRSSILAAALLVAGHFPAFAESPSPPVAVQAGLQQQVEAILAKAPPGTRWGLLVTTTDGREVVAIDPDHRFIPASNTKLFTTAAALAMAPQEPATSAVSDGTSLMVLPRKHGPPDLLLAGGGGGSISTAPACKERCLKSLLDSIAREWRSFNDVIADNSRFTDQRWSPGMSWNNIGTDSGTATSAIVIDHNEVPIVVTAGAAGQPPGVRLSPYFKLVNEAVTVATGQTDLKIDRSVLSRSLRLYGTIAAGSEPWRDNLGLDDPADFAGWLVRSELAARGVRMRGSVKTRHRPVMAAQQPVSKSAQPSAPQPVLAGKTAVFVALGAPLAEELQLINKVSQNLHSELMIRRLAFGDRAILDASSPASPDTLDRGLAVASKVFVQAGIPRAGFDFSDGSGMSTYNRVSPRAAIALLRWGKSQSWGRQWRESFPIGGVDGTLRRRFAGTPLQGRVFAKTGTLNATNALSGYLIAASSQELTFSIFANDVPDGGNAVPVMDEAVLAIAAAN